jgi:FAD/FMN-containing dehydrogenase
MPQAAALAHDQHVNRYPIDEFLADIAGIEATTDIADLKRNSRDYYWYSPILADLLKNKAADVVVTPCDEGEVVRVAAACVKQRIPLTVRGGATGNYGQCVTLEDGSRYKRVDADQLGFKHEVDPMGLLNPGKMRSFVRHAE